MNTHYKYAKVKAENIETPNILADNSLAAAPEIGSIALVGYAGTAHDVEYVPQATDLNSKLKVVTD